MKQFTLLIIFCFIGYSKSSSFFAISSAISQVANNVFSHATFGCDIIIFSNETSNLKLLADAIGKSINVPYYLKIRIKYGLPLSIQRPAVFLLSTWDDYTRLCYDGALNTKYESTIFFLIYVAKQQQNYFLDKDSKLVRHTARFFYDYFINVQENSIVLSTFEMYQRPNCEETIRTLVNEFSYTSNKWKHEKFSVDKFEDLNQCRINVSVMFPQNLAAQVKFDGENKTVEGYVTKFNDIISKKLNFSFAYVLKEFYLDISPYDGFRRTYDNWLLTPITFDVGSFREISLEEDFRVNTVTKGFTKVDKIFLISRFKPYTMLEKVFLPFSDRVWCWFTGTLAVLAITSIGIMVFAPQKVKRFVFGLRVQTPLLNMSYVLLGGGLGILPGRNFSRFVLMVYILFCLVIRTAYQGIQFNMMLQEMRPRDIQTVQDLSLRSFTIYAYNETINVIKYAADQSFLFDWLNRTKLKPKDVSISDLLFDGSKNAFLTDTEHAKFLEKSMNGTHRFTRLKEVILSDYLGFRSRNNDFIFRPVNRIMGQLYESGLSEWIISNEAFVKYQEPHAEPVKLTMHHLEIWIHLLAYLLCCSMVLFLFEVLALHIVLYHILENLKHLLIKFE